MTHRPYSDSTVKDFFLEDRKVHWLRICIVAVLAAGIVMTAFAGPSWAAHVAAQTGSGYGAPQDLGEQTINAKGGGGGSSAAFWVGILVAAAILGATGFIGWRRTHNHSEY